MFGGRACRGGGGGGLRAQLARPLLRPLLTGQRQHARVDLRETIGGEVDGLKIGEKRVFWFGGGRRHKKGCTARTRTHTRAPSHRQRGRDLHAAEIGQVRVREIQLLLVLLLLLRRLLFGRAIELLRGHLSLLSAVLSLSVCLFCVRGEVCVVKQPIEVVTAERSTCARGVLKGRRRRRRELGEPGVGAVGRAGAAKNTFMFLFMRDRQTRQTDRRRRRSCSPSSLVFFCFSAKFKEINYKK